MSRGITARDARSPHGLNDPGRNGPSDSKHPRARKFFSPLHGSWVASVQPHVGRSRSSRVASNTPTLQEPAMERTGARS